MMFAPYFAHSNLFTSFLSLSNFDLVSSGGSLLEKSVRGRISEISNPAYSDVLELFHQVADVVEDVFWVRDGALLLLPLIERKIKPVFAAAAVSFFSSSPRRVCRIANHLYARAWKNQGHEDRHRRICTAS